MKVAIVYPYIAHYRLPIFAELSRSSEIEYSMIADLNVNLSIKTIDPNLGSRSIKEGGLRLLNVKNRWLYQEKILWQRGLLRILRKNDFDAIIFLGNTYYLSTWAGIIQSKLTGKKIYLWTHGVTSDNGGLKWKFRKMFYNLSDGLLLYGHKAKEVMAHKKFNKNKMHVVYNSLDYKHQIKFREKISALDGNEVKKGLFPNNPSLPLIVFVGRLTKQKKLEMIIKSAKVLSDQNFKINVLFIGEGSITNDLNQLISNYKLENYFNFYGACYEESKLAELIGISDLCVSPGEVGLTAVTALTYGTPVISHNDFNFQMPEYEAIVPGTNGDLFKRDSIQDLAKKIKHWITSNANVSRDKIRRNCYEVIDSKYNPQNQTKIINEILTDK